MYNDIERGGVMLAALSARLVIKPIQGHPCWSEECAEVDDEIDTGRIVHVLCQ